MTRTLFLICLATCLAAARPNPDGTWKLNPAGSDFGGAQVPADLTLEFKTNGDDLFLTQSFEGQELNFKLSTDGKKMTNDFPGGTMTSTHKWDGDVLAGEILLEGDGWSATFKDRTSYSADGKTMTMMRDATGPDGERKQKLVFDKQ